MSGHAPQFLTVLVADVKPEQHAGLSRDMAGQLQARTSTSLFTEALDSPAPPPSHFIEINNTMWIRLENA